MKRSHQRAPYHLVVLARYVYAEDRSLGFERIVRLDIFSVGGIGTGQDRRISTKSRDGETIDEYLEKSKRRLSTTMSFRKSFLCKAACQAGSVNFPTS